MEAKERIVRIVNVVASARLEPTLNLMNLLHELEPSEYDPETFPGLIYRRSQPKATMIMFSSGKLVTTGARSEGDAHVAIETTLEEIQAAIPSARLCEDVNIENVVAVADYGKSISLTELHKGFPETVYEPKRFPGVILKTKSGAALLIFSSGRILCAGTRGEAEARREIGRLFEAVGLGESPG